MLRKLPRRAAKRLFGMLQVIDVAGFTNEWVRITGLQNPSLVKGCTAYTSFLQPMLSDMRDLSRLSKELGDDREVRYMHGGILNCGTVTKGFPAKGYQNSALAERLVYGAAHTFSDLTALPDR